MGPVRLREARARHLPAVPNLTSCMVDWARAMKGFVRIALLVGFSVAACPALSWDKDGHAAIGMMAWRRLQEISPSAANRVRAILSSHPGIPNAGGGWDPSQRYSSLSWAARWPDDVRRTREDRDPWHYKNLPVVWDSVRPKSDPDPSADSALLSQIDLALSNAPRARRAIAICWIAHIVGDIHQPLHCANLFSQAHRQGDRGGNNFLINQQENLHHYWDHALAVEGAANAQAEFDQLMELPDPRVGSIDLPFVAESIDRWMEESKSLAATQVYKFNGQRLRERQPLPNGYDRAAYEIARKRARLGAERLARLLAAMFAG